MDENKETPVKRLPAGAVIFIGIVAIAAAALFATVTTPQWIQWKQQEIPAGRSYTAVGAFLACMPAENVGNAQVFRAVIRTPDDLFFDVFFRNFHQPLQAGMAVGIIKYHECGKINGQVVHCFDSFQVKHEGLPPLDNDGKRIGGAK